MKRVFILFFLFIGVFLIPFFPIPNVYANPDSITYNPTTNIITVDGYSTQPYCNATEVWEADLDGNLQLMSNKTIAPESETLRPNGNGTYQEWETLVDSTHYNATNDESDSSYIATTGSSSKRDIQNITNPTILTVASIEVFVRIYDDGGGQGEKVYIMDKLGATERLTSSGNLVRDAWTVYSTGTLTTNPTGTNWTIQNVTDLEVGVQVQTLGGGETLNCSEIWLVVAGSAWVGSLDRQVRPADSLALRLTLVVTGYNQSGVVTLNGKDVLNFSQTEDITITENGDYNTTEYWGSIDTNGVSATGKYGLEITQARWGVTYRLPETQGFLFDATLQIGMIPTFSYFKTTNEFLEFSGSNYLNVYWGYFFSGDIMENGTTYGGSAIKGRITSFLGYMFFYNTKIFGKKLFSVQPYSNITMVDCLADVSNFQVYPENAILRRVAIHGYLNTQSTPLTRWETVRIGGADTGLDYWNEDDLDVELYDIYIDDITNGGYEIADIRFGIFASSHGDNYISLLDSQIIDNVNVTIIGTQSTWNLTVANRKTFNVVVHDGDDLPIENANVTVRDCNGTIFFSVLTNSTGQIPEQKVTYNDWYYHNATYQSGIWTQYFPLNLTITKTDFISYSTNITMPSTQIEGITLKNLPLIIQPQNGGYAGFGFFFLALVIGLLIGGLVGFGSKK